MLSHVFFWSLPRGTGFWHKDGWWVKTGEERAYSISDNENFVFEIHYGCVITLELAEQLNLEDGAYRSDEVPTTVEYQVKLFGEPLEDG